MTSVTCTVVFWLPWKLKVDTDPYDPLRYWYMIEIYADMLDNTEAKSQWSKPALAMTEAIIKD